MVSLSYFKHLFSNKVLRALPDDPCEHYELSAEAGALCIHFWPHFLASFGDNRVYNAISRYVI